MREGAASIKERLNTDGAGEVPHPTAYDPFHLRSSNFIIDATLFAGYSIAAHVHSIYQDST